MSTNVTIEKTIHFNCPLCLKPVEALAEVSGKLISCPSCGQEFNSPNPARKASPWWLGMLCGGLTLAGLALVIPVQDWLASNAAWARTHETPGQQRLRLQAEAQAALLQQCTNEIVGLQRIINQDLRLVDENPGQWTAQVTAEFVNRAGGVERTELPFVFQEFRSPVDNMAHVICGVDRLKISRQELQALNRKFGLTNADPTATASK